VGKGEKTFIDVFSLGLDISAGYW